MSSCWITTLEQQTNRMGDQIKLLSTQVDQLQAARIQEQNEVYELVQDLFSARCYDNEQGAAWLNEAASQQWVRTNKDLHAALQALACRVEAWVMEDEEEPA